MATATVPAADLAASQTLRVLAALTGGYPGNFAVRLWEGEIWQPGSGPIPFVLVLKHPGAVRAMFWPFDRVGLGESYIFDDFDIEGDVFAFTDWLRHISPVRIAFDLGEVAIIEVIASIARSEESA